METVEVRDAAGRPKTHRTVPTTKNCLAPKGSSTKSGKPPSSKHSARFSRALSPSESPAPELRKPPFPEHRRDRGCKGSGRLPLAPRPLSQMAEGSAATKHLMTCDKCGQTAGPGWASSKPLIGQGGLINNSAVTAGVLLSGRDGAPAASRPLGQALYGMGSSRTASDPCMVKCC